MVNNFLVCRTQAKQLSIRFSCRSASHAARLAADLVDSEILETLGCPKQYGLNDIESRLALDEYHPFWYLEQVPKATPVLFVFKDKDLKSRESAEAAAKRLAGLADVIRTAAEARGRDASAKAAAIGS
jgi:hypothetical protein